MYRTRRCKARSATCLLARIPLDPQLAAPATRDSLRPLTPSMSKTRRHARGIKQMKRKIRKAAERATASLPGWRSPPLRCCICRAVAIRGESAGYNRYPRTLPGRQPLRQGCGRRAVGAFIDVGQGTRRHSRAGQHGNAGRRRAEQRRRPAALSRTRPALQSLPMWCSPTRTRTTSAAAT